MGWDKAYQIPPLQIEIEISLFAGKLNNLQIYTKNLQKVHNNNYLKESSCSQDYTQKLLLVNICLLKIIRRKTKLYLCLQHQLPFSIRNYSNN